MKVDTAVSQQQGFTLIELLIVIGLTAIIATAVTSVIISTTRTSTFTNEVRTVMDDGRISLDRIRQDLRGARRVMPEGSGTSSVRFWLDHNQDGIMEEEELICYAVAEIGSSGRYELLRWAGATAENDLEDCAVDPVTGLVSDPPSHAQSIARTLVANEGSFEIFSYEPMPDPDPHAPRTRLVTVELRLDVRTDQGPGDIPVETTVRLRNVH